MDPTDKISTIFFYFLFYQKYSSPKNDLFCYLWGKYLGPFNIFNKKMYDILVIFFLLHFPFFATRIRLTVTDPNGSKHWLETSVTDPDPRIRFVK